MSDYAKYYEFAVNAYKLLHQYPELNFNLDKTVEIVKGYLSDFGIEYTEKYGKSSVVAEIGEGDKTIALRADMDALPIEEKSGLEFSSKIKGQMHACGHDSHTAIMLAVAWYLKDREKDLNCKVRFIFQPSEEGTVSGAKTMLDNGVMLGVDKVLATHCEPLIKAGEIGVCEGDYMAACMGVNIVFIGKSAHATLPEQGIDAIAMANQAYIKMQKAVKEIAGDTRYIWSVGRFNGGRVNNVICDECNLGITFRFYDYDFASKVERKMKEICNQVASEFGGSVKVDYSISTGAVINDKEVSREIRKIAEGIGVPVNQLTSRMSSEDFGWFLTQSPGALFRYGVYEEKADSGHVPHTCSFKIYPPAMLTPIKVFTEMVLNFK